nr:MAG TPA: hypothetical protein [Caudoviricetes sp.]
MHGLIVEMQRYQLLIYAPNRRSFITMILVYII